MDTGAIFNLAVVERCAYELILRRAIFQFIFIDACQGSRNTLFYSPHVARAASQLNLDAVIISETFCLRLAACASDCYKQENQCRDDYRYYKDLSHLLVKQKDIKKVSKKELF